MKLGYALTVPDAAAPGTGDSPARPFDALRVAADYGFDGVDLSIRDPSVLDLDALERAVTTLGLTVSAIATGQACTRDGLCLTAPDPSVRESAVARLLAQTDAAHRFGALLAIGVIHGRVPDGESRRSAEERLLPALRRVARAARGRGVRLVVEPIRRHSTNWLHTAREVLDLIARLGEDNVGVLLDTFHMSLEEADPAAAVRDAAPRLWHFHVAEENRRAPGWGHLDFAACVLSLRTAGYDGFVSAEVAPDPTLDAAARQTIAVMRPLVPRGAP
ncbi:MAG TPA: sugar phosphate isomerase/epimerase family protein [bacterium]|nr:sugar phosphate isomerase/epimerase family protein [bacterium]